MFVGMRRGFERAIKEAEEEGMKKGIEEGMKKGIEEGKEKGLLEARKEGILKVLRKRFGESVKRIMDKINEINDSEKLDELFDISLEVKDMDEFEKKMNKINWKV